MSEEGGRRGSQDPCWGGGVLHRFKASTSVHATETRTLHRYFRKYPRMRALAATSTWMWAEYRMSSSGQYDATLESRGEGRL